MIKVNYTYINRIWINTGNKLTSSVKYIILFGLVNTMKTLLTHRKCLNDFRVIPEKVKEDMKPNKPENFNKTLINITAEQDVAKGVQEFTYIYCSICQEKELPSLITKFKINSKFPHSSPTNSNETTIIVKHNKKLKMRNIEQLLNPKLSIFDKASDELANWVKDFWIKLQ